MFKDNLKPLQNTSMKFQDKIASCQKDTLSYSPSITSLSKYMGKYKFSMRCLTCLSRFWGVVSCLMQKWYRLSSLMQLICWSNRHYYIIQI